MFAMGEDQNLTTVRRYFQSLEEGEGGEALRTFFTEDAQLCEYPNRFVPALAKRGLSEILAGAERGQQLMAEQHYEVRNAVAFGDSIALEVDFRARLRVPFEEYAAGEEMRASMAVFLTFRDGRICAQRNYDCFDMKPLTAV